MRRWHTRKLTSPRAMAWRGWGERFQARFGRRSGAWTLVCHLHTQRTRAFSAIEQRWTRPVVHLTVPLHWLDARSMAVASAVPVNQTILRQVNVVSRTEQVVESSSGTAGLVQRVPGPWREIQVPVLQRIFERTRREAAAVSERHVLEQLSSRATHATERLLERSNRVDQSSIVERTMTLRRESPVLAQAGGGTTAPRLDHERVTIPDGRNVQTQAQTQTQTWSGSEIDVERLAAQVIRQIDRKVVARRERMGRT